MANKFSSLKDKLEDEEYIESLSNRRKKEILICNKILEENDLSFLSSIDVGYHIAKEKYIKEKYGEENLEEMNNSPLFWDR